MPRTILLNNCLLFLCCSILLGIGIVTVCFQSPITPAGHFFSSLSIIMVVTASVMLLSEWFTGIRWVPALVLLLTMAGMVITCWPPAFLELKMSMARASIWAVQWLAMMYWFYCLAFDARKDR